MSNDLEKPYIMVIELNNGSNFETEIINFSFAEISFKRPFSSSFFPFYNVDHNVEDFFFSRELDKYTPIIFEHYRTQKPLPKVSIFSASPTFFICERFRRALHAKESPKRIPNKRMDPI